MVNKIFLRHNSDGRRVETIVDLQFHQGSFSYALLLTDQGNLHVYYLYPNAFEESTNYRGSIHLTRGSVMFAQEPTGLYLAVLSPLSAQMSFHMCRQSELDQFLPAHSLVKHLRSQNLGMQAILEVYELGTGKLKHAIPLSSSASSLAWSPDGKYLSVSLAGGSELKTFHADRDSQENIWTLIDQLKRNTDVWNHYPIKLEKIGNQSANVREGIAQTGVPYH